MIRLSKTFSLAFFLTLLFSFSALAERVPLFDEELTAHEKMVRDEIAECQAREKNVLKKIACLRETREKYFGSGIRGTEKYSEKTYSSLNFPNLESTWKKLKQQQETARRFQDLPGGQKKSGEVTAEMLETEIQWVESRLSRMQRRMTEDIRNKLEGN